MSFRTQIAASRNGITVAAADNVEGNSLVPEHHLDAANGDASAQVFPCRDAGLGPALACQLFEEIAEALRKLDRVIGLRPFRKRATRRTLPESKLMTPT